MENEVNYGKKSVWQWIVIYLIIALVAYGAVYYFFIAGNVGSKNISNNQQGQIPTQQVASPTSAASNSVPSNNIFMVKTNPAKGNYLSDFQGMTVYVFDQDKPGISNCAGKCITIWPPYTSGATAQSQFPMNITIITRTDGSKQFAWKGLPLYYYASDKQPGDILGDGIGGAWHLVRP